MVQSLRVLLAGLIDYAGLFPPAALPMPGGGAQLCALLMNKTHNSGLQCWIPSARTVLGQRFRDDLIACGTVSGMSEDAGSCLLEWTGPYTLPVTLRAKARPVMGTKRTAMVERRVRPAAVFSSTTNSWSERPTGITSRPPMLS